MTVLLPFMITIACIPGANGGEPTTLPPAKAFVVFTQESWGCLNGQEIRHDVTASLSNAGASQARIEAVANPEDVENRNELYLFFAAKPVLGVDDYLVAKLWCAPDSGVGERTFRIKRAEVRIPRGKPPTVVVCLTGNASVFVTLGYARSATLQHALVTCPEAGARVPYRLAFLGEYPLETEKRQLQVRTQAGDGKEFELNLDSSALTSAKRIAGCVRLLHALSAEFGERENPYLWQREALSGGGVERVVKTMAGSGIQTHLRLKADDESLILIGGPDFVAQVRQRLALRDAKGRVGGAELWIALTETGL